MYFDSYLSLKIRETKLEAIEKILVADDGERYKDRSEWVRAAIERQLRVDKKRYGVKE